MRPGNASKKRQDRLAIIIFAACIMLAALVGGMLFHYSKKPALDEQTLCPLAGEKLRYAVLIDKSDKWGRGDVARVRDLLLSIYREVPTEGRLAIYSITGDGRNSTNVDLVFDICNPGSEAECNALYQNCRKVNKHFKDAFDEPLRQIVSALMEPGQASSSPILETVSTIVKDSKAAVLKLYVISDFMENGARFRFYSTVPLDDEMIEQYPLPRDVNITVEAYLIQRRMHPMQLQNAVQEVWTAYFNKQGTGVSAVS